MTELSVEEIQEPTPQPEEPAEEPPAEPPELRREPPKAEPAELEPDPPAPKKRGRPPGSKNKPKASGTRAHTGARTRTAATT